MVFDPPGSAFLDADAILRLHRHAFARLPQGGVLASYCRDVATSEGAFEEMVSRAAALEGREGRIFAHTTQPFDFPTLLRFPESRVLKGLIVQVE
jgi:23S rRNA G2069 N7-methylase RlmK/C1962 C5-methylase RlmI